jgi:hypothetical protein
MGTDLSSKGTHYTIFTLKELFSQYSSRELVIQMPTNHMYCGGELEWRGEEAQKQRTYIGANVTLWNVDFQ